MLSILLFISILLPYSAAYELRHVNSDGNILIDSSSTNYAISSATLQQNGWKTVSVNGDNIAILGPNCQSIVKSSQTLTEVEQNLINGAKSKLDSRWPWGSSPKKYFSTRYSDGRISSQVAISMNNRNFDLKSGGSISKNDDNNFSIAKPDLPNNLARVFLNNDVVTFGYLNGQVQMKPINCLQQSEYQLVQQLRSDVKQAEEQQDRLNNQGTFRGQFGQSFSKYGASNIN